MGIRIHKLLGYGLSDVVAEEYDIQDSRFNLEDGYFAYDAYEQEEKFTYANFIQHLKKVMEEDKQRKGISMLSFEIHDFETEKKKKNIYDLIHHNGEFGLPNVVLFQTGAKDWSRYDNIIDYMEDTHNVDSIENKVTIFDRPIYPYESWTNLKTGLTYFEKDGKRLQPFELLRAVNWMIEEKQDINIEYLKSFGFDSIEDVKKNVVPMVPEMIVELCKYLKVFKDDATILQLKPMIYTYWG